MSHKTSKDPNAADIKSAIDNKLGRHASRRGFLKTFAVTALAAAGTAGVAKKTASVLVEKDLQREYDKDVLAGDGPLTKREYVLMSEGEKKDLIRAFEESYRNRG